MLTHVTINEIMCLNTIERFKSQENSEEISTSRIILPCSYRKTLFVELLSTQS